MNDPLTPIVDIEAYSIVYVYVIERWWEAGAGGGGAHSTRARGAGPRRSWRRRSTSLRAILWREFTKCINILPNDSFSYSRKQ